VINTISNSRIQTTRTETSAIHQFDDPGISGTRWSDIVARGQLARVSTALQREDRHSVIYPTHMETLYEEENLADRMKAQKAASIIQQVLHPDTVLFTFAANIFKDRTEEAAKIANSSPKQAMVQEQVTENAVASKVRNEDVETQRWIHQQLQLWKLT
jgi:hypothetical protein